MRIIDVGTRSGRTALALALLAGFTLTMGVADLQAQTGTIRGRLVNAQSLQPIAGAQVSIAALNIGTLSAADGSYNLVGVPAGNHTVRAQFIGYRTAVNEVTVTPGAAIELNISLSLDALALDEIVVTGTPGGTQRRAIGNVVERIDVAGDMETSRPNQMQDLLQSRAPGLSVMATGAGVGNDGGRIRLRGSSSAALGNEPIVYVDGVRMFTGATWSSLSVGQTSRLNDINPEDIESIEVIKGPAAATLYGSEASGGVIQIITKRGATGAPRWDVSAELGGNWIQDVEGKAWTLYGRNAAGQIISMDLLRQEREEGYGSVTQVGPIQRYNLSVQGGTDLVTYFGSINRTDEEGYLSHNWADRTQARMSISLRPSPNLQVAANGSYMSGGTRLFRGLWRDVAWGSPVTRLSSGGADNPVRGFRDLPMEVERDGEFRIHDIDRTVWSITATHNPTSWLRHRLVAGTDVAEETRTLTVVREDNAPFGWFGANGLGLKNVEREQIQNRSLDYAATITLPLTRQVTSATSSGLQYFLEERWLLSAVGREFASPALSTVGAAARNNGSENLIESAAVGVYVQQQFDWEQRRFLTVAVRADDHSSFGSEFEAAIYPKVSATWVLNEEPFWRVSQLQSFRLRAAWGAAGKQPAAFSSQRLFQAVPGPENRSILTPTVYGNPNLGPERGEELEAGFDASFLNQRATLAFTGYTRSTTDAIVERDLPLSVGFPGTQLVNLGEISNWGTETSLDLQVVQRGRLRWDWTLGMATMRNRIESFGEGVETLGRIRRARHHVVGFPLGSQFEKVVLSADFVSGNSGAVTNMMCDGGTGPNNRLQGGGAVPCAQAPELYYGPGEPTWQGTFLQTLNIGERWELRANIHAEGGNWMFNEGMAGAHTTQGTSMAQLLRDDPIYVAHTQIRREPTGMYRNDFARLRELAVRYSIQDNWVSRFGASRGSITASLRNLNYLWTRDTHGLHGGLKIYDWEMGTGGQEFGGESQASDPSRTTGTVTVRLSF